MQERILELRRYNALNHDFDLDEYIGLVSDITDPFNIFARLNDLEDLGEPYVYFYTYSLGRKKAFVWGVYEKETGTFLIDGACKYDPRHLITALEIWKTEGGYKYLFNSVKDRFSSRIEQLVRESDKDFSSFRKEYMILRASDPYNNLNVNLSREEVEEYLFLNDLDEDDVIDKLILLRRPGGMISKFANELFLYLEPEDYRIAKHLIYIHDTDSLISQERKRLSGSFIYLFLEDLIKILNMENMDELIEDYLRPQVEKYEEKINRTDIDTKVRKSFSKPALSTLKQLAQDFEYWIERSKYNKERFIASLKGCPEPDACIKEPRHVLGVDCAAYYHGDIIRSQYDLSLR